MKRCILIFGFLATSYISFTQNWAPVSTGLSSSFTHQVFDMIVYNNKLIVGGSFDNAGGLASKNIAAWNGTNWENLDTGLSDVGLYPSAVNSLQVYNNELIAGGFFNDANGVVVNNIAKWNGSNWVSLGLGSNGQINALAVYNNELYAGGLFDSIGGIEAQGIAKWNGTNWSSVGGGIKQIQPLNYYQVTSLHVFNSSLYVGGIFDTVGVIPALNIAKWNGTTWSALASGIPTSSFPSGVNSIYGFNNDLYVGNYTTGISKWNGTTWQAVGGGLTFSPATAWSTVNYMGKLIVGGEFLNAGLQQYAHNIAAWDGTQWSFVGTDFAGVGVVGLIDCVQSVCVFQNQLYAGGLFVLEENGTVYLNGIARFTGTIGSKENNSSLSNLKIYPNPAHNFLTIKATVTYSTVEITDVLGNRSFFGASTEKLDISDLKSGVYLIKLIDDDKQLIGLQKFIKE